MSRRNIAAKLMSNMTLKRTLSSNSHNKSACCLLKNKSSARVHLPHKNYTLLQTFYRHLHSSNKFDKQILQCTHSYGLLREFVKNHKICFAKSNYSHSSTLSDSAIDYMESTDFETQQILLKDMKLVYNFISEEEEQQLFDEVEPYLKRLRYEDSHWDDAIHGYRETERRVWSAKNKEIIQRVRDTAFPAGVPQLAHVHVLDLKKEGHIKPHIDAVKFCGSTIAGISLLSPSIMRLVHKDDKTKYADFLVERRSLYIMSDAARYDYTHEILPDGSIFKGNSIQKDRRISVICRNEPE